MRICLLAQTLGYVEGGGHFWVYLNWALGFQRAGATVTWLETIPSKSTPAEFARNRDLLHQRLQAYGLPATTAFMREDGLAPGEEFGPMVSLSEVAATSDLLVNLYYRLPETVTRQFHRKALIDIDPGLLQTWVARGYFSLAPHDYYFSISDAIGSPGNPIPTLGVPWQHTPPCVDTLSWPLTPVPTSAPFTTVSHWEAEEYVVEEDGSFYENTKKSAFTPFLGLARKISTPVELALCIDPGQTEELQRLRDLGWKIRPSFEISTSPATYQSYIQGSRGEFSVSKPAYVKLQSGWISDRTLCYLSSGKPAIVQDTGPIRFFPKGPGLLRFRTIEEAQAHFKLLQEAYSDHSQAARHLAETVFDARLVATRFLELVFG